MLPNGVVFQKGEGAREVSHGASGKVDEEVQYLGMGSIEKVAPVVDREGSRVTFRMERMGSRGFRGQDAKKLTVYLSRHIEEGSTGDADGPDTHSLDVIRLVFQIFQVTTVADLHSPFSHVRTGFKVAVVAGVTECT